MATIRKLFSMETINDLEKENLALEEKSLEHTKSIVEMQKKDEELVNEMDSIWSLNGKDNEKKRINLQKQHRAMEDKIYKEDKVRNMINNKIIINGSIIHEKREAAELPERLSETLPKLYKIKKGITVKNAEQKHSELIDFADDKNIYVPDGKRYDEEYLRSIGITGGKWSLKYKRSINCKKPKGFSQKQHCKSKSKTRKNKRSKTA
jgi:hypothetical protein